MFEKEAKRNCQNVLNGGGVINIEWTRKDGLRIKMKEEKEE